MYSAILGALAGLADVGSQVGNFFHNENVYRMQRAYNSPAAQVARLQSAGINPQGVASQIAGQNQGDFNKASFDFGKSFSTASGVSQGFANTEKLYKEIESLSLDNMFKTATFKDRVNDVAYTAYRHYLDTLLMDGKITAQIYDNLLRDFEYEWQKYLADQDSIYNPSFAYYDPDSGFDVITNLPTKRALSEQYKRWFSKYQSDFARDTYKFRTEYERQKTAKVTADAARAAIAAKYEEVTGSPFNSKMPWVNLVINVIRKLAEHIQSGGSVDPLDIFNLIMGIDM